MIIVFDTWSGLCNQFYDINFGINFCIAHNFKFTFRNCSFRNKNLVNFEAEPFNKLFDISSIFKKYKNLYVNFDELDLTDINTYNTNGVLSIHLFKRDYIEELMKIKKKYVILRQFWPLNKFLPIKDPNIYSRIRPSNHILELYYKLKNKLISGKEKYNCIHYRYEDDFTEHFGIKVEPLKDIILKLKNSFKNPKLKIYIATGSIKNVINLHDEDVKDIIFTKNEDELEEYNYEELAFVDYMFGLNSNEVYGHKKSSFSKMLNSMKGTNNYYA
jgi:hypothetical protein